MGRRKAVISHLAALNELGITVVEIMPVAQFPGGRNWGYDGVYTFAAQNTYGGPEGLKHLVDACHRHGLAVTLDVVYNHLGAEGNYLWDYGPYFTDRYKTAWGSAVNFDGPHSDEVRGYFIENALYWLRDFHLDALRLDAVHAMLDFSAGTFLEELAGRVDEEGRRLGRRLYLIGESDLNDQRIVRTPETHGFGLHAQWADDLHHALHLQLTGEHERYYRDFVTADGSGEERALFWRSWAGDDRHGLSSTSARNRPSWCCRFPWDGGRRCWIPQSGCGARRRVRRESRRKAAQKTGKRLCRRNR